MLLVYINGTEMIYVFARIAADGIKKDNRMGNNADTDQVQQH